jgi:hypothetical protein
MQVTWTQLLVQINYVPAPVLTVGVTKDTTYDFRALKRVLTATPQKHD